MRLGFDFGFGFVKATNEKGKNICFPTALRRKGKSKIAQEIKQEYFVTLYDGETSATYAVGKLATALDNSREWNSEQQLDERRLSLFVGTAAWALRANDDEEEIIDISVGLPIDYYENQREELHDLLSNMEIDIEINGIRKKFVIDTVIISQQALGAFFALTHDISGNMLTNINPNLLKFGGGILDIGYKTDDDLFVDIRVSGNGEKEFFLNDELSGSGENGMHVAYDQTALYISDMLGGVTPERVEDIINNRNGLFPLPTGGELDLKPYFREACEYQAKALVTRIRRLWNSRLNEMGVIYLTGGGGIALYDFVKNELPRVEIQIDSTFANARGYLAKQALYFKANGIENKLLDVSTEKVESV